MAIFEKMNAAVTGGDAEIHVVHSVNDYPDGTREAVLMACTVKDGKIRRVDRGRR